MRNIDYLEKGLIAAGCGCENHSEVQECQQATELMLGYCTYPQLQMINQIFKSVVKNESLQGATGEQFKAAMIDAIQQADFS